MFIWASLKAGGQCVHDQFRLSSLQRHTLYLASLEQGVVDIAFGANIQCVRPRRVLDYYSGLSAIAKYFENSTLLHALVNDDPVLEDHDPVCPKDVVDPSRITIGLKFRDSAVRELGDIGSSARIKVKMSGDWMAAPRGEKGSMALI